MAKKKMSKRKKMSGLRKGSKKMGKRKMKRMASKSKSKRKLKVSAIPKGYNSVTPYLIIADAANAIEFYKRTFGAKEMMRMENPNDGKVMHAELKIGDAKIMVADEFPEMNVRGPQAYGGTPVSMHLYVVNVDNTVEKAVSAGAKLTRPIEDRFYGDRCGVVEDPYGHIWSVSTHIENLTPAKMRKRAAEFFAKQ